MHQSDILLCFITPFAKNALNRSVTFNPSHLLSRRLLG